MNLDDIAGSPLGEPSGRPRLARWRHLLIPLLIAVAGVGANLQLLLPRAHAVPAPEVEYLYNVVARRHYAFPESDALSYGRGICEKVNQGESYARVIEDVKSDVLPNDEYAANYLISYSVGILCPAEIWQLRNSAAHYRSPAG
ncbi:DUF732 domain-containing protein [Mycobacterium vicinigordonae]|uniref:DUF732 domain-containing protein n=1 Tax=Mycobacterium vicinigordonae TaxID=1719132 RepID=A0A7D6IBY9_9MYCO|nr:DUF732 domain-containing protein [Mycobacterium vicinigordonae]